MRRNLKQFERPAGPHNPRVTEDQGAQSVIVNLRHPGKVEDDVHILRFRKRDYRRAQDCFRFAYCQVTSHVENPYPFFFALMEVKIHGRFARALATLRTLAPSRDPIRFLIVEARPEASVALGTDVFSPSEYSTGATALFLAH